MADDRVTGPTRPAAHGVVAGLGAVLLAVHGLYNLDHYPGAETWQWMVVVALGLSGVLVVALSVAGRCPPAGCALLAGGALGAGTVLFLSTGAPASFFLLWLFAIPAVFSSLTGLAVGVVVTLGAAVVYVVAELGVEASVPAFVAVSRVGLIVTVGAAGMAVSHMWERANRIDRQLSSLLDTASDAVIGIDAERRIRYANETADALFAMEPGALIGLELERLLPERFRGQHPDLVGGFVGSDAAGRLMGTDRGRLWAMRGDGSEFPVEVTIAPFLEGREVVAIASVRDVTERYAVIDALMERERQLEALLEARDEFVASVSHELRTPLTAVVGFARLLAEPDSELDPGERQSMLDTVVRQGSDLTHLVDDLLVIARGDGEIAMARVPVDLMAQTRQVMEAWDPDELEGVSLAGDDATAVADPSRVRQVLRNLLTNAIRHGGDHITIEVGTRDGASCVSVVDDGDGIPPAARDLVFRPFERLGGIEGVTASIGLGLPVSLRLARDMGGDLELSVTDVTEFRLSLPPIGVD